MVSVCACLLQVAIPALHVSLGIFQKLYELLENAAHKVDLHRPFDLSCPSSTEVHNAEHSDMYSKGFEEYISRSREALGLRQTASKKHDTAQQVTELANWLNLNVDPMSTNTPSLVPQLFQHAKILRDDAMQLVSNHKWQLTNKAETLTGRYSNIDSRSL